MRFNRRYSFLVSLQTKVLLLIAVSSTILTTLRISQLSRPEFESSKLKRSVTIVAACANKKETLGVCLTSWLCVSEVSRIILVNWGGIRETIQLIDRQRKIFTEKEIILVNVFTEEPFWLTVAYNIGFDFVGDKDTILKVDCDTIVEPYLLSMNPISRIQSAFYTGDWKLAANENQKHLNGIFMAKRDVLSSVGGFDERIKGYGWDDSNLFDRLEKHGWRHLLLNINTIRHLEHAEASRCNLKSCNSTGFQIFFNRCLVEGLPNWNKTSKRVKYLTYLDGNSNIDVSLDGEVSSIHDGPFYYQDSCARKAAKQVLGWFNRHKPRELNTLETKSLIELANLEYVLFYHARKDRVLILHAMHGLGNRLRALASALAAAEMQDLALILIWPIDVHMAASFEDLFIKPRRVQEIWEAPRIDYQDFSLGDTVQSIDYMNEELKYSLIPSKAMITYVRSAYVLNIDGISEEMTNQQLRNLKPSFEVQHILERIRQPDEKPMLGIHIRKSSISQETPNLGNEYSKTGTAYIEEFRKITNDAIHLYERKAIEILRYHPDMWIYLSSDSQLPKSFMSGVQHVSLPVECRSRSTKCIRFAVADLIMLGRSKIILGSFWSSFTEIASRIAGVEPIYPYNYHQNSTFYSGLTGK
eukprot:jgi/Picsp_1/4420/NSC_06642-R1_possible glycosyltransferase